jgi:hypothetical protein
MARILPKEITYSQTEQISKTKTRSNDKDNQSPRTLIVLYLDSHRSFLLLIQLLEKFAIRALLIDHCVESLNSDTLLSHSITVANSHSAILKSLVVNGNAEWSTNCILTAITLTD